MVTKKKKERRARKRRKAKVTQANTAIVASAITN